MRARRSGSDQSAATEGFLPETRHSADAEGAKFGIELAGQGGFTVAELLLAAGIAAMLSLAVLALFSGGVRTWQRLSVQPREGEVQRALLALASDLRQSSSVMARRNRVVMRWSSGDRVRYRVLRQSNEDWFIREKLGRRGRWTWEPKWPLFRTTKETLALSTSTPADSRAVYVTVRAGRDTWTVHVWLRQRS